MAPADADAPKAVLGVRHRAGDIARSGEQWVRLAGDLGRQYAWPWWNTLLTHPVLAALGNGVPAVAASPALWALAGTTPTTGVVPWLVPVWTATRTMAGSGRPLAPGEFGPSGERIHWQHTVSKLRAETVVIEATAVRPTPGADSLVDGARSAARVWNVGAPEHDEPFELLVALALHAVTNGLVIGTGVPEALIGHLPPGGGPVDPLLLAVSAAVGFLAAHGVSGVFGPAGLPQELAVRSDAEFSDRPVQTRTMTVLNSCSKVHSLILMLLSVVAVPAWRGGLLTMAIPPTGCFPGRWDAAAGGR